MFIRRNAVLKLKIFLAKEAQLSVTQATQVKQHKPNTHAARMTRHATHRMQQQTTSFSDDFAATLTSIATVCINAVTVQTAGMAPA